MISTKFADTNKAPNGTGFGKIDHLSLFIAQEAFATLDGLRSGLNVRNIAILAYLSLGLDSQYLVSIIYVVLLYGSMDVRMYNICMHGWT